MKKLFYFLLLLLPFLSPAQGLRIDSTRFYCNGNPETFSEITDIIQTKDKGFFFTGKAAKPGGGILPPCPGNGANPVMGKLDSLGNIEWIKSFCDTPIRASTVCQTADGGYAINGGTYTASTMSIFRYDAQGNYLWRKDYGWNANCGTRQIIATADKGFMLLGIARGIDSDITVNYSWPPVMFQPVDWVLIKLDSLGNKQWVRTLGTSGDDLTSAVLICDSSNNYYLIGDTESKDYDCADVAGHPGWAIYIIKLNSAGNVLWSRARGAGFVSQVMYDERDNSILVTGRTPARKHEFANLPRHGGNDIFLMKLDTAANFQWANMYGTSGEEQDGATLCKAPNGGYFIAANASSNTTPTPAQLISTDSNGQLLQHRKFATQFGYIARYIFPYQNSFCLFGQSLGTQAPEGTGQNCLANTFFGGSRALAFSTLSVVPLGIRDVPSPQSTFTLSPNPTRSSVELRFETAHPKGSLTITTAEGKQIYRQHIGANEQRFVLNTSNWISGTYLVCFQPNGSLPQCHKLLVQ